MDAEGDTVPQNNRATATLPASRETRAFLLSGSDLEADQPLVDALQIGKTGRHERGKSNSVPATLAEMQGYDAIFLSNVAAGDLTADFARTAGKRGA